MMRFQLPDFIALIAFTENCSSYAVEHQFLLGTDYSETYHVCHLHWPMYMGIHYSIEVFPQSERVVTTVYNDGSDDVREVHMLAGNKGSFKELIEDAIHFADIQLAKM